MRFWAAALMTGVLGVPAGATDFALYVTLPTNMDVRGTYGENLSSLVDMSETPLDPEGAIVVYQGQLGLYPKAGIHLVEMDPDYMDRHFDAMRKNLHRWVPEGYDGVIVVDYEAWWAAWDHNFNFPSRADAAALDQDFKDDWLDYIEQYRPHVIAGKSGTEREIALRDSYEEAAVRFLIATIRECKRLRPDAKWGYYNYPRMLYGSSLTPGGVVGYGDCTHYASEVNDRLAPLWDELDVTAPRVYPPRRTVPDGKVTDKMAENTITQQREFLASHVREARRLAPQSLVIPFVSTRYYGAKTPDVEGHFLNELNTYLQFTVPKEADADGVLLWGDSMTSAMARQTAAWMNDLAIPITNRIWEGWYGKPFGLPGAAAVPRKPSGGPEATPSSIPAAAIMRFANLAEGGPEWGHVREGEARIHMPSHSPTATVSTPVHRGGRIVGRRAVKRDEAP
ncbi:MAG: hypothetical protein ACF8R7_14035 [Phycisphaerales bacterium JB039]